MAAKRPRLSREGLRELLVETGGSILREDGLGTGAETLTFKKVFDRVEEKTGIRYTNASVIRRVWKNLSEFQADVLVAIALKENSDEIDLNVDAVVPVLTNVDFTTPESREEAMRELCRVGGAASLQTFRKSTNWPSWIGMWRLVDSGEPLEDYKEIEAALVSGYDAVNERLEGVYAAMIDFLGFRLSEKLTLRQFAIAADSLGRGCGLRDRIDHSDMEGIERPTGPGGAAQEWTLFAIAFEALVQKFFEIDPDWVPNLNDDAHSEDPPQA
jgi:hypothetical protein